MAALILTLVFIGIISIGFFGGFTTFDAPYSIFHLVCHSCAGILLALVVTQKLHYLYIWYIFAFFSVVPLLAEVFAVFSVLVLRKRRW